jgi:predicted secreted hydrolase
MLPGSRDRSGAQPANEMYYVALTRMDVAGTLTRGGVVEKVTGSGWLDRQWGSPSYVANHGWDWFGLQLDNGDDLILNRMRDLNTGKVVKVEATVLTKDRVQTVETPTVYRPTGTWTDPATHITFPAGFTVTLPRSGYTLQMSPAFADQTIPVIGIGDAIWEGVVNVTGTGADGTRASGHGYMELVGYRTPPKIAKVAPGGAKTGNNQ